MGWAFPEATPRVEQVGEMGREPDPVIYLFIYFLIKQVLFVGGSGPKLISLICEWLWYGHKKRTKKSVQGKVEFCTLDLWDRSLQHSSCLCGLYELILFVLSVQEGSWPVCTVFCPSSCVCLYVRVWACEVERVQVSLGKWLTHLCRQVAHSHKCLHAIWRTLPVCLLNYTVGELRGKEANDCSF